MRTTRWGIVAIVAIASFTAACGSGSSSKSTPTSTPTSTTATTVLPALAQPIKPTGDAALDASLTKVARFVERERDHLFR